MDKRKKQAAALYLAGHKALLVLGYEKQASDPKAVVMFLEKIRAKEGFRQYKKACLEKQAADFSWNKFWSGIKPMLKSFPNKIGVKPGTLWGGLGGAALGALGGGISGNGWRSTLLGGLTGAGLGGYLGNTYQKSVTDWLDKNPFMSKKYVK